MNKSIIIAAFLGLSTLAYAQQKNTSKPVAPQKPATAAKPMPIVDRSKKPTPGPAPEIKLGKIESFELPNGLKVYVVENHKLPKVAISLVLDIEPTLERDAKGYSDIAGQLLSRGTKTRTKDQLDKEIDFIGASFNTSATGAYGECLKKHQEKLLDLFSDVILNSEFKQEELDKIKTQTISGLASQKDDPDAISNNVKDVLLFGKNHPYGEVTTEKSVENVTLDKCNSYYKTFFRPNVAYLAIVGDITPAEAKTLVEKYLGNWEKVPVPQAKYDAPKDPGKTRVAVINKAGAVQSVVNIGYAIDLKHNNEDLVKVKVMNNILGGNASSRLFMNLREKHSWTYGAYSKVNEDEITGSFKAFAKVRNAVTDSAVVEMLKEMKRLKTEQVPQDELEGIKNYMTGTFAIALENPQTIANMAINMDRYNLPKDYYNNYLKNIAAVTSQDILATSQKYMKPENCWVIAVGNREEIGEKLKGFATDKKVEYFDVYGNEAKAAKAVPEGVTAKTVLDNYIQAMGGKARLEKMKSISTKMTASIQGMNLDIVTYQKAPNKYVSTWTMNGSMVVQKQIFDGAKGQASGMQGKKMLTGDELKELELQATMYNELNYEKLGYKMELKGIEEVNGKDAYVLEITSPLNKKETEYYDVATGLKVKTVKTEDTPQGTMTQSTEYTDYRPVAGVKFPHEITTSVGPQVIKAKVSSIEIDGKIKDEEFKIVE